MSMGSLLSLLHAIYCVCCAWMQVMDKSRVVRVRARDCGRTVWLVQGSRGAPYLCLGNYCSCRYYDAKHEAGKRRFSFALSLNVASSGWRLCHRGEDGLICGVCNRRSKLARLARQQLVCCFTSKWDVQFACGELSLPQSTIISAAFSWRVGRTMCFCLHLPFNNVPGFIFLLLFVSYPARRVCLHAAAALTRRALPCRSFHELIRRAGEHPVLVGAHIKKCPHPYSALI